MFGYLTHCIIIIRLYLNIDLWQNWTNSAFERGATLNVFEYWNIPTLSTNTKPSDDTTIWSSCYELKQIVALDSFKELNKNCPRQWKFIV